VSRLRHMLASDAGEIFTLGILGWLAITSIASTTILGGSQVVASVQNKNDLTAASNVMRDEAKIIEDKLAGQTDSDAKIMLENAAKMKALADKAETGANLDVAKNVSQTAYDAALAGVPLAKLTKVGKAVKFGWDVYGGTQMGQAGIDAATAPPADITELTKDLSGIDFSKVGADEAYKDPALAPVETYILEAKTNVVQRVVQQMVPNKKSSGANAAEYTALTRELGKALVIDMAAETAKAPDTTEVELPDIGANPFLTSLTGETKLIDPANKPSVAMTGISLTDEDKAALEAGKKALVIGQYYGANGLEPVIVGKDSDGATKALFPLVKNSPAVSVGADYKPDVKTMPSWWDGSRGSCPFLYTFDGQRFVPANDIISVSRDAGREYVDSMLFDARPGADGLLEVRVVEVREEESFLDMVALEAVNVPDGYDVALSPDGRAFSVRGAVPAFRVSGASAGALATVDGVGLSGYDGMSVVAEFAAPGPGAVLLMTVDGFEHDSSQPRIVPKRPAVRVEAFADRRWTLVGEAHPRELADTTAFDLAPFVSAGRVTVRVTTVSCDTSVYQLVDRLALSSAPSGLARTRALAASVSGPEPGAAAALASRDGVRTHLVSGQRLTFTAYDAGADAYVIESVGWYRELPAARDGVRTAR
jgi:hypothetical protein